MREGRYENIVVSSEGYILATTTDIKIAPKVYSNFPQITTVTNLGKYMVIITPTVITIEGGRAIEGGYYRHPHIVRDKPCFGTFTDTIASQHSQLDIVALLRTISTYLTAIDEHGWYRAVHAWLPDAGERCSTCWYLQDKCECDKCAHCGEHVDDCSCDRCPNSGDVIDRRQEYCVGNCRHAQVDDEGNYDDCRY